MPGNQDRLTMSSAAQDAIRTPQRSAMTAGVWVEGFRPMPLVDEDDGRFDEEEDFEDRDFAEVVIPSPDVPVSKIKETMKKRHLVKHERDMLHKPTSDWFETPDGEVCRSAETLVVKDIITKFTKK